MIKRAIMAFNTVNRKKYFKETSENLNNIVENSGLEIIYIEP